MAEVMEMLALSPTMEEGVLAEWLKNEGDAVDEGEVLAEVETDKATMEMESFYSGTVLKLLADAGSTVNVGDPLVIIGDEGEDISELLDELAGGAPAEEAKEEAKPEAEEQPEEADEAEAPQPAEGPEDGRRIKASPLARRMAEDKEIELSRVEGSGPGGRIIKRDIEAAEKAPPAERRAPAPTAELTGVDVSFVPGEAERLSQMRKTIARRLVQVWQTTPHFYLTREIDMAPIMKHRADINAQLADSGAELKLSVNDMIVKAAAVALSRYPDLNVAFTDEGLYRFDEINVGVAVAIDQGLITPTIKNADQKSLGAISREIRELAGRAHEGQLTPEEYSAHTFSISNLGMYGIDEFMAVINPPDAAILACGAVKEVPVVEDGELTVGTRMKVSLACDHRAVDGAVGAEWLAEFVALLENPMMLLV